MKGMTVLYSAIFIVLTAVQCRKKDTPVTTTGNVFPVNQGNSVQTYLALGDSYTIGQSVATAERFPAQTTAILRNNGINIADPKYVATTGWTTDNLNQALDDQHITGRYDVVTLLIGVNDQFQRHDTTGYRERFRNLLVRSISFAGNDRNKVFVLSIPDYGVTPFATYYDTAFIRKQINEFNDINRQETLLAYCHYLDITNSTREAATDPTLVANDGLHPSGKEYAKWAAWLAPMMKQVLQ